MADSRPAVHLPTMCRLCGHQFPSDPLRSAALLNANPQAKLEQIRAIISPLMKHLNNKHPRELAWTQELGGEYAGLLAINLFQSSEPLIEAQRDYTRWKIHTMTTRARVTNERIAERLAEAFATHMREASHQTATPEQVEAAARHWMKGTLARAVLNMVEAMRDVLEENGRYASEPVLETIPQNGQPS